jgi:hypothetical protein
VNTNVHVLAVRWDRNAGLTIYVDGVAATINRSTVGTTTGATTVTRVLFGDDYLDGTGETLMATYGAVYVQGEATSARDISLPVAYARGQSAMRSS